VVIVIRRRHPPGALPARAAVTVVLPLPMSRRRPIVLAASLPLTVLVAAGAAGCGDRADAKPNTAVAGPATAASPAPTASSPAAPAAAATDRAPNELGRIPVLEYHLIVPQETNEFTRTPQRLRQDLEELRRRGYVPVNMTDVLDKRSRTCRAAPRRGARVRRRVGLAVPLPGARRTARHRPDERGGHPRAVQRPAPRLAAQGGVLHAPRGRGRPVVLRRQGDRGAEDRVALPEAAVPHKQGYELCNHTLYHARLDKSGDRVQEFIARGDMAIDSAVPGYKVRTFALPLGMWPKNRPLAWGGSWTDPKSGRTVRYAYDAVLEVSGNPNESPYDPKFDPHSVNRQIMFKNALESTLNQLDKPGPGGRYVSDGDPKTVARPAATPVAATPRG
jgi:peptidoglycan/xylan/chitin deacetylase (PgdA/CDA1 family)